ncbi:hypothetical protein Tco_0059939 [Tanacetum coccineum]
MEELCQPTLDGRGGPIAPIAIQAMNFGLKNVMIQQVQNSCPFRGPGDYANKHLDKFLHVTQSMKMNGVSVDALRLYLFPYSLQHRAAEWFDRLPRNSITTFDQMAKIFLGKYFPPSMVTKLRNSMGDFGMGDFGNGYQQKRTTKRRPQRTKRERMDALKSVKSQKVQVKVNQEVNPVKVKAQPKLKKYLMGPLVPI